MMRKITLLLIVLSTYLSTAQNTVTIDGNGAWKGFVNAFNLDDTFAFGFEFNDLDDLKATFTATSVVLAPNFTIWTNESNNSAWFDNPGDPPSNPNKYIEANSFIEDNSLAGSDLTFVGSIGANNLDGTYTAIAFIKALDPNNGFAAVVNETVALPASGEFSVSATAAQLQNGLIIQYGFAVTGLIADPATEASLGSVTANAVALSTNEFNQANFSVSPNPTDDNWKISATSQIENVQVFDILGKQVMSLSPSSLEVDIPAERLKSGLYLARITGADGSDKTIRLLKN